MLTLIVETLGWYSSYPKREEKCFEIPSDNLYSLDLYFYALKYGERLAELPESIMSIKPPNFKLYFLFDT